MLNEDTVVFDNPSFDNSIIGITTDGSAVYSYDNMVREYMDEYGCDEQQAIDWIEFNTIRSIPYADGMGVMPTIVYEFIF
ncbi:MAG: hypothetical protein KBS82_05140 [Oscillospiraceae bacterium]|nr:hypothetical protein [Candidatus Limimonas egerieequi]